MPVSVPDLSRGGEIRPQTQKPPLGFRFRFAVGPVPGFCFQFPHALAGIAGTSHGWQRRWRGRWQLQPDPGGGYSPPHPLHLSSLEVPRGWNFPRLLSAQRQAGKGQQNPFCSLQMFTKNFALVPQSRNVHLQLSSRAFLTICYTLVALRNTWSLKEMIFLGWELQFSQIFSENGFAVLDFQLGFWFRSQLWALVIQKFTWIAA